MSCPVIMCRESRLSCNYLPNSVTLWCRTLWCYYCYAGACKVEHQLGPWQLLPPASLCHFPQPQPVYPTHLVQKYYCRNSTYFCLLDIYSSSCQVIVQELNQMTSVLDITQKSCSQRCHISIHRDDFRDFLICSSWPVPWILWGIAGYIHQM